MIKLKWTETKSKYFAKPILTAEHDYSWLGWLALAVASLGGLVYLFMEVVK